MLLIDCNNVCLSCISLLLGAICVIRMLNLLHISLYIGQLHLDFGNLFLKLLGGLFLTPIIVLIFLPYFRSVIFFAGTKKTLCLALMLSFFWNLWTSLIVVFSEDSFSSFDHFKDLVFSTTFFSANLSTLFSFRLTLFML